MTLVNSPHGAVRPEVRFEWTEECLRDEEVENSTCRHILIITLDIVLFPGVAAFNCGNYYNNSEFHSMWQKETHTCIVKNM